MPLIGNALKPLARSVLVPSGQTQLVISHKSLEESGLLTKGIKEKIKNEAKEQKGGFIGMLLGTLGPSLLGNILKGNGTIEWAKEQLEQVRIFNDTPYSN